MTSSVDDFMMEDDKAFIDNSAYETPQAAYTTVLVVGATGRIGKVLVRKLLLRGNSRLPNNPASPRAISRYIATRNASHEPAERRNRHSPSQRWP